MVNKPKQRGTAAESAVVSFLRTAGFPYAERLALQGGKDRGDITGIPGVVIEVKAVQEYAFNQWLTEARVERDNAGADFGLVVAKPRLVGTAKTGQWYALMYSFDYLALVSQAARTAKMDIPIWKRDMSGNSISTVVGREVKLAQAHAAEAGTSHSCVLITPKGVKDPSMYYVVTTLQQMSDLLVLAGYGRRDDPPGA
jgi:hypothetical protein